MFRVICIDAIGDWTKLLKEGECYTVECDAPCIDPAPGYILKEAKSPVNPQYIGYVKTRFVPLSEISETEMEKRV